jgi:hypothetical protein
MTPEKRKDNVPAIDVRRPFDYDWLVVDSIQFHSPRPAGYCQAARQLDVVLSLLREAAGLNPPSRYKWEDFGISVPADQVLSSGISLISRLIAVFDGCE